MPLFLQHTALPCRWGIWKTEESPEELLAMLPHQEVYREGMRRFTAAHRRLEWLAVRVLLYTLSGEEKEIAYHPSGKPYLADDSASLSIRIRKVMWLLSWDCRVGKWVLTSSSMVSG